MLAISSRPACSKADSGRVRSHVTFLLRYHGICETMLSPRNSTLSQQDGLLQCNIQRLTEVFHPAINWGSILRRSKSCGEDVRERLCIVASWNRHAFLIAAALHQPVDANVLRIRRCVCIARLHCDCNRSRVSRPSSTSVCSSKSTRGEPPQATIFAPSPRRRSRACRAYQARYRFTSHLPQ